MMKVFGIGYHEPPHKTLAVASSPSSKRTQMKHGPLGKSLLGDGVDAVHVAEEMDDVLGARQQGQIAWMTSKQWLYQSQQAAKQLVEGFPSVLSSLSLRSTTRSWDEGPVESNMSGA
jgi:hypothetical protein